MGKRPVAKRSVDADESDEKRDRQLERAYSQYDTGDQERCQRGRWINGGEDSIGLDTRY